MSQVIGGAYVELTARSAQFLKGLEAAKSGSNRSVHPRDWLAPSSLALVSRGGRTVGASLAVYTSFDDAIRAAGAAANATGDIGIAA